MRNKYGFIIIIFMALFILSGATLFLAKDKVVSFLDKTENLASLAQPEKVSTSTNTIDNGVINSDHFKSLKNNVNNFYYKDICLRPNTPTLIIEPIAVKSLDGTEATSTPIIDISCHQGNNNPFLVKKK